jgi:hypothetical protein
MLLKPFIENKYEIYTDTKVIMERPALKININ